MNNNEKGRVVIFSAPSGSGKTSIVKYILEHEPRLDFSVSATNRPARNGEKHGVHYYFLSTDEFRKKIDNNEFLEWEEVYDNTYYGTLLSELERVWSKGKHLIFDVDVMGGLKLKKMFGKSALAVYVKPPDTVELKKRLIKRGTDPPGEIERRVAKAETEMKKAGFFDKIIVNDDLDKACNEAIRLCSEFLNGNNI